MMTLQRNDTIRQEFYYARVCASQLDKGTTKRQAEKDNVIKGLTRIIMKDQNRYTKGKILSKSGNMAIVDPRFLSEIGGKLILNILP